MFECSQRFNQESTLNQVQLRMWQLHRLHELSIGGDCVFLRYTYFSVTADEVRINHGGFLNVFPGFSAYNYAPEQGEWTFYTYKAKEAKTK